MSDPYRAYRQLERLIPNHENPPPLTIFVCGPNVKCEHDWSATVVIDGGESAACAKCGALAIDEAMWL